MFKKYLLLGAVFGIVMGFQFSQTEAAYKAKKFRVTFIEWPGLPGFLHANFIAKDLVIALESRDGNFERIAVGEGKYLDDKGWANSGATIVLKEDMKDIAQIQITGSMTIDGYHPLYIGKATASFEGANLVDSSFSEEHIFQLKDAQGNSVNAKMILEFDNAGNLTRIILGSWPQDLKNLTYE